MNRSYLYLHNHPKMEETLGVDKDHVIVDRDAWEDIRNKLEKNSWKVKHFAD